MDTNRKKDRQIDTERQTDGHRQKERQIDTDRKTDRWTQTEGKTNRHRQIDRQMDTGNERTPVLNSRQGTVVCMGHIRINISESTSTVPGVIWQEVIVPCSDTTFCYFNIIYISALNCNCNCKCTLMYLLMLLLIWLQ